MDRGETKIRPSYLYVLTLIGLAICIASSLGQEWQHVPLGTPFGLLGLVPVAFWIGIGLMVLSMAIGARSGSERLFFFQALVLFVALWSIPALFEKYPTVWDSYMHYNSSLEIARTGAVPLNPTYEYAYNYPGFFVVGASYTLLGNPPALPFLQYWPVFVSGLTLAAIYLFVRTYIPSTDYRIAFLFAAFANVWLQFNYSPQSLGLVAGLMIFVCMEREGTEWRMAALGLFAFIVIAHPTTLVFVIGAILIKEVLVRLYTATFARNRPKHWDRPWPVGAFVLIWLGWFFTGASYFSLNLTQFIFQRLKYLGNINESVGNQFAMRSSPENILGAVYSQLRWGVVVVFLLLTVIALLTFFLTRKKSPVALPKNILALLILPFLIIPLDTLFFNGQLYDRGIMYIILVAPLVFVPVLLDRKHKYIRPVAIAAIFLVVIMCASTLFYQETLYVSTDESIAATDYLADHAPSTYVAGGYYPYNVWSDHGENYMRIQTRSLYNQTADEVASYSGGGAYLFDDTTESWYRQWGIMDVYTFYENQSAQNYKVYDNGAYWAMFVPRR
jgi:hypothetical protein